MASKSEPSARTGSRGIDMSWDNAEHDVEPQTQRDWKRIFLVTGLAGLSWVATYVGMLELIEANMGDLPLIHKLIIGFSVGMLMVMVVWLLDQMFSDVGWFSRLLFAGGYVFLTVISVGFGFGFYWKVLESRSEASRSAESAVGQVQTSLHAAMTRLEQLQGTLDSLTNISTQKADTERQAGTSCPNSKPGDGPRRKMRDDDAGRFKFASDFVKGRVTSVKSDIAGLDSDLTKIVSDDKSTVDAKHGNRNEFMRNLGRKLDMTVVGFNAFRTDPQLKQIRVDLNERADKATFVDTKGGTYTCPDGQLTTALKGVVRAIDELPSLEKPKIAAVEGSEAVIEAFRRLTATFYGALSFKLPPSPEELRELQKKAVQSVEVSAATQAKLTAMSDQAGLSKRDYVPLAIAVFVDLCLLLVSMKKSGSRLQGLLPKMRAAERGPVIQILSRFNEIHHDKQIRENFEVFRHVVFDFHGDYYAAVPLNAPYRPNLRNGRQGQGYGVSDAEALIQEAHLLANLFASFEKEKIFTRVHSPLLGTKTIQKRLRRQGSKFANSEAFRIYRFKDGAWSDIILGAVMGAARRVEADKRRRRVEEDIFRSNEPTLDPHVGPESEPRIRHPNMQPADVAVAATAAARGQPYPASQSYPYVVAGSAYRGPQPAQHGPDNAAAAYDGLQIPPPNRPAAAFPNGSANRGEAVSLAPQIPRLDASNYSMARQPAPWPGVENYIAEAPVRVRSAGNAANSNTAPMTRSDVAEPAEPPTPPKAYPENVLLHPAAHRAPAGSAPVAHLQELDTLALRPTATEGSLAVVLEPVMPSARQQPMVTVAAVRETVTYTLPVSEAALPQSLFKSATAKRSVLIEANVQDLAAAVGDVAAPRIALPSPLPPPLPAAIPVAISAALQPNVISLPEAAAEQVARNERTAWEIANNAGFESDQSHALDPSSTDSDDLRTMALRLRPEKRDG